MKNQEIFEFNSLAAKEDHIAWDAKFAFNDFRAAWHRTLNPLLMSRPIASDFQNRQDYLMRVATANRLDGIPELCRVMDTDYSTLVSLPDLAINRILDGVPMERIAALGFPRYKGEGLVRRGLSSRARVCPKCISEGLPLDSRFNLAFPVQCRTHHIMPIDICPKCSTPISYFRNSIEFCDCGFPLCRGKQESAPNWLAMLFSIFAPWHLSLSSTDNPFTLASSDYLSGKLIRLLLTESSYLTGKRRRFNSWLSSNDFPALNDLILDWPNSLERKFKPYFIQSTPDQKWRILKWVKDCRSSLLLESVHKIISQYREEGRKRHKARMAGSPNAASVQSIRTLAKLDAAAVRKLMERDLTCTASLDNQNNHGRYWFSEEQVAFVKNYFASTVNLSDASKILGCSESYLRALVKSHFLRAEILMAKPRSPRFKLETLETWLANIQQYAFPLKQVREPSIALSRVPAYSTNNEIYISWSKLFQSITDGGALLFTSDPHPNLSQLYVRSADLLKYGIKKRRLLEILA